MLTSVELTFLLGHRSWAPSRRRPVPNRRCKYKTTLGSGHTFGGVCLSLHLLIWCILASTSSSFPSLLPPHHRQQHQLGPQSQRYLLYHLTNADVGRRVALSSSSSSSSSPSSSLSLSTLSEPQALRQQQSPNCPGPCTCMWKNGKETATCDRRQLGSVPVGLASTTQVIDLSGNSLNHLPANVFLERGLVNLQRIFLVDCHLLEISAESFVKLSNLVELDLSNNSLAAVPSKAFAETTSLRRLSLAGNRIREIKSGAFLALGRLNHLDLAANQLVHLETDAFRGLRSLQTLKLNRNQLQSLPAAESFVQFLPAKMAAIELHDNPWHCDCHLKPIREWLVANNVPVAIKPLCSAPVRLQGLTWNQISSHDFSCPPQIHSVTTHFYKHIGNNVTITCPVTGYPQPAIYWLFETTLLESEMLKEEVRNYNLSAPTTTTGLAPRQKALRAKLGTQLDIENSSSIMLGDEGRARRRKRLNENDDTFGVAGATETMQPEQILPSPRYSVQQEAEGHMLTSTLSVHNLKPYDTQRIVCYARNVGGYVMKNFTLIVSTQEPFSSGRSMDFIVTEMFVIFLAISLLLVLLLIFVTVFLARFKKRSFGHHHVHSSENNSAQGNNVGGGVAGGQTETSTNLALGYDDKPVLSYCDLSEVAGKCLLTPAADNVNNSISVLTPNGNLMPATTATNLLMIDMATLNNHHHQHHHHPRVQIANGSDHNSTDLSSQSTTATSMTGNSNSNCQQQQQQQPNGSATTNNTNSSSNGVSPNNSIESGGSSYFTSYNGETIAMISNGHPPGGHPQPQYLSYPPPPTDVSGYVQKGFQHAHQAFGGMPPDILATTANFNSLQQQQPQNDFQLTATSAADIFAARVNVCDYHHQGGQYEYPLLNLKNGVLPPNVSTAGDLIYGRRIAPTRLQSVGLMSGSLSFNDNLSQAYVETSDQPLPSTSVAKVTKVTFADQTMTSEQRQAQTRTAMTYGTLQRPSNGHHNNNNNTSRQRQHNLNVLVESSVDSGEMVAEPKLNTKKIVASPVTLDEAEEDDYYNNLHNSHNSSTNATSAS